MSKLRSIDDIATMLETTGRYKVLRRVPELQPDTVRPERDGAFVGVALDCEATGVEPLRATPIEVCAVKFAYDRQGRFEHVIDVFEGLQEPPQPLDPNVSRLVGLTDADLAGQQIDKAELTAFLAEANFICAHNAAYDRVLLERWLDALPPRPWACTMANIDWLGEGLATRRLGDVLLSLGLFNDGHRARRDVESLLAILRLPLPSSCDRSGLTALLDNARRCTTVIFAEKSAIAKRGILKQRGYRWAAGEDGEPRAWWIEVDGGAVSDEITFLTHEVYDGGDCLATSTLVSALHRFRPLAEIAAARMPAVEQIAQTA